MTDPTAKNGRAENGTFALGNRAAAGRSSRAAELRKTFVEAITPEDISSIAAALVKAAKSGDIAAAKLVLDRLGRPDLRDDSHLDEGRNRVLSMLNSQLAGDTKRARAGR